MPDHGAGHTAVSAAFPQQRAMAIGAEPQSDGSAHFRVWAPKRRKVAVIVEGRSSCWEALAAEGDGYFSGSVTSVTPGERYRYRLDDEAGLYPDPASRFQPEGPHGPSELVEWRRFRWTDSVWPGVSLPGQVFYEMHIGSFTEAGTFAAAADQLDALAQLGVTVLEIMPIAEFPGRFGWGYDGVNLFAPTRLYGRPDEFRRFVDRAHGLGLGVILDVVYNHLGPDGNYLSFFSDDYVSHRYLNEWGDALNFDGERSAPVREWVVENARYWIREFHLDGLRLDATQQIFDASPLHLVTEIAAAARQAAGVRSILVVAENERQQSNLVHPPAAGGMGLDALWNDDFHHSAMVAMTGRAEAYYSDHLGRPQELISALKWGFLFQGQHYAWQDNVRGSPSLDIAGPRFVTFLQNHDQIANSGRGERIDRITTPGRLRAMTALYLLAPATPMLFQGQEFAASAPFHYFADHTPELAAMVANGRIDSLSQFPSLAEAATPLDPADPETFRRCRLDQGERDRHTGAVRLHTTLLRLRREDSVFCRQDAVRMHGAVLAAEAFLLRFFGTTAGDDRLLLVNLGRDIDLSPAPEPLLAPPAGASGWELIWSSDATEFGGSGTPPVETAGRWHLPGHAAVVLRAGRP